MLDLIAFGALIKAKRGQAKITQETLALDVFGDSSRKGDISRIENAKTTPQEATIQKLCAALDISAAEMLPIRTARRADEQLENIPTLSREELQNLAARFELENAFTADDTELRRQLTFKADEYRALKSEVDQIDEGLKRLSNLKAAAQDAIARVDLDEVEELLSRVQEVELEEAAKTAELRATNALLRGKTQQAFVLLSAAADSFAAVSKEERITRRLYKYTKIMHDHALKYGGSGFEYALKILAVIEPDIDASTNLKWTADLHIWKANTLQEQGKRTSGGAGANLLAESVRAYRDALRIRTEADHPVQWATTQNNLAAVLRNQGTRTSGEAGADLLAEAVRAYRDALRIRTETDHPVQWAQTQYNMAIAEVEIANHDATLDPRLNLNAALTHVENALKIYDPTHMPFNHNKATKLRTDTLDALKALDED